MKGRGAGGGGGGGGGVKEFWCIFYTKKARRNYGYALPENIFNFTTFHTGNNEAPAPKKLFYNIFCI